MDPLGRWTNENIAAIRSQLGETYTHVAAPGSCSPFMVDHQANHTSSLTCGLQRNDKLTHVQGERYQQNLFLRSVDHTNTELQTLVGVANEDYSAEFVLILIIPFCNLRPQC